MARSQKTQILRLLISSRGRWLSPLLVGFVVYVFRGSMLVAMPRPAPVLCPDVVSTRVESLAVSLFPYPWARMKVFECFGDPDVTLFEWKLLLGPVIVSYVLLHLVWFVYSRRSEGPSLEDKRSRRNHLPTHSGLTGCSHWKARPPWRGSDRYQPARAGKRVSWPNRSMAPTIRLNTAVTAPIAM